MSAHDTPHCYEGILIYLKHPKARLYVVFVVVGLLIDLLERETETLISLFHSFVASGKCSVRTEMEPVTLAYQDDLLTS